MLKLERMEVCGFKSFSDKTELTFPAGITAIVGPNGCGKSNIGDAINWVLGEQSPKMLRGRQMADVIFNGTEARKPLGLAEVTLNFSGAEGLPHGDQGRVSITRRLFRSGESEYRLNGARTRLMDIQDLLRRAKVGARTYATIEQGRIDQVLNAKPRERRALIEDAAGVSGYKHKRRLAELKLEATHANLLRVNDIVTEVQRQINSLKRQAAKARRYRRLRDELRRRESIRFARQALELDRELSAIRESEAAARDAESAASARLGGLEAELVSGRDSLEREGRELRSLSERQHQCEIEIDRAEAQTRACRERISESESAARQQREDAEGLAAREAEADARAQTQRSALEQIREEQQRLQADVEQERAGLEELELEQRRLREEIDALRSQQFESMSLAADLRNRRRNTEEAMERSGARRDRLEADHAAASSSAWRARAEADELRLKAAAHEQEVASLREELLAIESRLRESRERHDVDMERLAGARETEKSATARLATLEDVETRFTGVSDGVKALLATDGSSGIRTHGVVADYVEANREVEGAAESYLQWLLPAVILENDADARRAAEFLRNTGAGRTSMISRDHPAGALAVGVEGNGRSSLPAELLADRRVLGRLREGLRLRSSVNGAVAERIGDAVVVDSLDSALELHRLHPAVDYLTKDGDVVYASGVISAGGNRSGDQGLLAHRRRLEELRVEADAASTRISELQRAVENRRKEVDTSEAALAERRAAVETAERDGVEVRLRAERLGEEAARAQRQCEVLAEELESLLAEADPLEESLRQAVAEARQAEGSHQETERLLADRTRLHEEREIDLKARLERAAELRTRASTGRQRQEASAHEARVLAEQIGELRLRREQLESGAASADARSRSAAELLEKTESELVGRLKEREATKSDLERSERAIEVRQRSLGELDDRARATRTEVEELRERSREAEVSRTRTESAREHLDDLCTQELEMTATEALAAAEDVEGADLEAVEAEVVEIRQKIERIGPVNMTAIEEFTDLEERHEFLSAQRTDLDKSMESLRESIRRINRQSRQRFEEAFEAVRRYYQETYKLLFSGGRADLRLEDGEDVLECGIEILAQPPGKRLTGVHLLSGGEKALSAIALLFAIFRYQPSPFCLLDEVDAALDDANVGRFMRMVGEYAKSTQFVIVTHNKLSMEVANLLYGVTMEERGVSKVVSLQLQ